MKTSDAALRQVYSQDYFVGPDLLSEGGAPLGSIPARDLVRNFRLGQAHLETGKENLKLPVFLPPPSRYRCFPVLAVQLCRPGLDSPNFSFVHNLRKHLQPAPLSLRRPTPRVFPPSPPKADSERIQAGLNSLRLKPSPEFIFLP